VKIGKREIILQHTTPRNMATAGRKSATLIQALRYLGQDQVDDRVVAILRRQIEDKDRAGIRKDLIHAPAWIADLLAKIAAAVLRPMRGKDRIGLKAVRVIDRHKMAKHFDLKFSDLLHAPPMSSQ